MVSFFVRFSAYQVIVLKVVDGAEKLPDDYDSKLKDVNNTNEENLNFYIAAQIGNNPVYKKPWKLIVGDDTTHGGFVNKALEKGEEYVIFQRALTRDNDVSKCESVFQSISNSQGNDYLSQISNVQHWLKSENHSAANAIK